MDRPFWGQFLGAYLNLHALMTARSECSVNSLLFEAQLPPEPLTAVNGCEVTERTAILPSRTRPANCFAQGLDGTGRHAADGTRHTRKYGDGGQPYESDWTSLRSSAQLENTSKEIHRGTTKDYSDGADVRTRRVLTGPPRLSGSSYTPEIYMVLPKYSYPSAAGKCLYHNCCGSRRLEAGYLLASAERAGADGEMRASLRRFHAGHTVFYPATGCGQRSIVVLTANKDTADNNIDDNAACTSTCPESRCG
ncbi:hypothetical protein B0H17DRAFT_1265926 [Mycena rosella]|uniref:Uncharacterized protein n=1 Tax=Mycena rosella TaxID=1033263 RepID=A0AAD7G0S3_MYCRO|nr:hypothetical protein B0H17DRAFT_1265926 [Mycena rosella]